MDDPAQMTRLETLVNTTSINVAEIKAELKEARADITETKHQATRTNGRVTALETQVQVDKALKNATATALAKRAVKFSWITPAVAGVGATFGATLLSHFLS